MGVQARIVVYAPTESVAREGAAAAFDRIAALEQVMSDYRPDSELSLLTRNPPLIVMPLSPDLYNVLAISEEVSLATAGAFDVTIGPIVRLWREARRTGVPPDQPALEAAWAAVGFTFLMLDRFTHTATLAAPGMSLDLGGIGKGYAAQQASDLLRQQGLDRHLVALAGDIVVGNAPMDSQTGEPSPGWRINIHTGLGEDDKPDETPKQRTLLLSDAAVSTSGDAEQFFELNGARYAHIIDPRPARSHTHTPTLADQAFTSRRGATVIAARGEHADALGTALTIIGPEWLETDQGTHRIASVLKRFKAHAAIIEWRDDSHTSANDAPRRHIVDPARHIRWAE